MKIHHHGKRFRSRAAVKRHLSLPARIKVVVAVVGEKKKRDVVNFTPLCLIVRMGVTVGYPF
ncbi:hypothetical protein Lalb_Chr00c03g0404311 [Lupinus albus]|uniref:Uncharacterized protein n=1 Tax=Lupinus albus TaxID=3870 RepID=A0A6A4NAS4_LUPAL|nr:hypothetical protein Lalb_Chr00c03g0404311 [Lupinus albus]